MKITTRLAGLLVLAALLASGCSRDAPERDTPLQPLREAFDAPPKGVATAATKQANARVAEDIAALAAVDFERARRGLIARYPDSDIRAVDDSIIWRFPSLAQFEAPAPDTVNPSLWRQSSLTSEHGLFEVAEGVYQLRGFDLAVMTLIEGETGWIVIDPLTAAETAAAALNLAATVIAAWLS